jgi:hypothetical protein
MLINFLKKNLKNGNNVVLHKKLKKYWLDHFIYELTMKSLDIIQSSQPSLTKLFFFNSLKENLAKTKFQTNRLPRLRLITTSA